MTLSDLQRLPVRATLFALITGFEMTMADFIKAKLPDVRVWMAMLKPKRIEKIQQEISTAQSEDAFVDALLYAQFCDKAEIMKRLKPIDMSGTAFERQLRHFEDLRNTWHMQTNMLHLRIRQNTCAKWSENCWVCGMKYERNLASRRPVQCDRRSNGYCGSNIHPVFVRPSEESWRRHGPKSQIGP